MRLETDGYMIIRNTKLMYETLIWLYTMAPHSIWYYRQVLVHLISKYTYIDSLSKVSQHHILLLICTRSHFLVDSNAQGRTFQTISLPDNNIVLHNRGCNSCYRGLLTKGVTLIERGWNEISGTFNLQLYS